MRVFIYFMCSLTLDNNVLTVRVISAIGPRVHEQLLLFTIFCVAFIPLPYNFWFVTVLWAPTLSQLGKTDTSEGSKCIGAVTFSETFNLGTWEASPTWQKHEKSWQKQRENMEQSWSTGISPESRDAEMTHYRQSPKHGKWVIIRELVMTH